MTIEYKDSKRIVTSGTEYKVHSFTSTGNTNFVVTGSGDVEYLVVGAGGGGGGAKTNYGGAGGGGGAGGFRTATGFGVTAQTYTITVGVGGSGGVANGAGSNGGNSIFSTITSTGGGNGGSGSGALAGDGGSGGGGSGTGSTDYGSGNTPSTNPSQGFNGALGGQGGYSASGGGGSSAVGIRTAVIGGDADGGAGGAGTASSIQTGTAITYTGGGGGGGYNTNGGGGGGSGGGGNGGIASSSTAPVAGSANLGGGGGGALSKSNESNGANGGSGIVIIKYLTSSGITATGGTITTITNLQSKPTNVPDNSILVEKDTAKRYWRTGASGLTEEQQLSNAELQDLNSGAKGFGEYVRNTSSKLYGKILTDIQFYLKKASPQAGAKVYARHYSSSDVLIHTYWEKLASDLPTSLTWTTETTLSGDTAFANGDYFIIEYTETDGTTATGAVQTNRKDSTNANQWDGSNSGFINTYFGSSSYLDTGNLDQWFKVTTATAPTWTKDGTSFNETFTGTQDSSWSSSGSKISIDTVNDRLKFDDVNDNTTDYLSKIFPEGALSDTMWTMLGQETFINSSSNLSAGVAQACYGAGNSNLDIKDNTNLSAIVAFIGGCGTGKTHRAMAHYYGANGTSQSACYSGSFSTEYWDTLWRESATTMRYKVFSDGRSRYTNVLDAPVTITQSLTGLDRFLAVGGNHGVTTRHTYGYVNAIEFWDGVNK